MNEKKQMYMEKIMKEVIPSRPTINSSIIERAVNKVVKENKSIFQDIDDYGIKQALKVNGLNQLPKVYEIANANLVKSGKDYYVKVTIYTNKEKRIVSNQSIGIDFGCDSQLTLSNGEKIKFQVKESQKLKTLDKSLKRKVKGSNNYKKCKEKRQKEYQNLTNQRKEIKNQIVSKLVKNYKTICFQDENLNEWKQKWTWKENSV
jgi:putative transposase